LVGAGTQQGNKNNWNKMVAHDIDKNPSKIYSAMMPQLSRETHITAR
jgi:hypothetical protein